MEVLFCYPRSAGHFSKPNCFAVWVRFLGTLKRPSVVPEPRSTGPCGTRLALSKITKRTSEWEVLFCYSRSAGHFSIPNCFAVWVRFLGELKRSSVVPKPRSTGPCGTHLALSKITKGTYFTSPRRNSRVFCELCSQKTPRGMLPENSNKKASILQSHITIQRLSLFFLIHFKFLLFHILSRFCRDEDSGIFMFLFFL